MTTNQDKSPELKKGEVKQLIIKTASESLPDFEFLAYKNSCYSFQRIRRVSNILIYEILHIISTLKDRNFSCSIASLLNQESVFSNQYNSGLINPHKDLKVLRFNSSSLNFKDSYYFHNGQVETTTKILNEIFGDFKKYGLPFLNIHYEQLKSNSIIQCGLDYIDKLPENRENLKNEIKEELKLCRFLLSSLKHPVYIDLKEKLQSISGQSKDDRQLIPKTAHELLELYWAK